MHTTSVISRTDFSVCKLAGILACRQKNLFDLYLKLYAQSYTTDDGRKYHPKHVQCYFKVNTFVQLVHLVGFTIEKCILILSSYKCINILPKYYL